MEPPKVCTYRHCDALLTGRASQLFCKRDHKSAEKIAAKREAARAGGRYSECVECGETFELTSGSGRMRKFCPKHDAASPTPCTSCGKMMRARTKGGTCVPCRPAKPPAPVPIWTIICPSCKSMFEGPKNKVYCDPACARKHRTRVKAEAIARGERFRDEEIYERDGWICQLCGEPIDRAAYPPHPRSRNIDHIVPIVRGGQHTRENCQAAHRICKMAKGSKVQGPA